MIKFLSSFFQSQTSTTINSTEIDQVYKNPDSNILEKVPAEIIVKIMSYLLVNDVNYFGQSCRVYFTLLFGQDLSRLKSIQQIKKSFVWRNMEEIQHVYFKFDAFFERK